MKKPWKQISKYEISGANGSESLFLESNGENYRIKNEFGNMFFEFDLVSGLFFTQRLAEDIEGFAADEVTKYLKEISNESLVSNDSPDLGQEQEDVDV